MGELAIIHAQDGREAALRLAAKLASAGHSVLRRDADDGGAAAAEAIIVVWSAQDLSPELRAAARAALARRALVPVRIGGAEPPGAFSHVWPIDLDGWSGDDDDPRWQFVRDEIDLALRRSELKPAPELSQRGRAPPRRTPPPMVVPVRMIAPTAALASVLASAAVLTTTQPSGVNAAEQAPQRAAAFRGEPTLQALAVAPSLEPSREQAPAIPPTPPPGDTAPAEAAPAFTAQSAPASATLEIAHALAPSIEAPAADPAADAAPGRSLPVPPPDDFAGPVFRDCVSCPDMTEIPAGDETGGFALSRREITFDDWSACVAEGGCRAYRPSDSGWGEGRRPAINVSYADAAAYAEWLSAKTGRRYRLPRAAEWRRAAPDADAGANLAGAWGAPLPTASFASSVYGLYDMRGNVWEWTSDCASAQEGPGCALRIAVGGAFDSPVSAQEAARAAEARRRDTGFRVARDL